MWRLTYMNVLVSASFIAAFFAGIAALFAPCCITVLLPTYLASIFKQRFMIFLMTFVYFLGLLTIFLPIGLGFSALSQVFSTYHNTIFSVGALFLILLGSILVLGIQLPIPVFVHPTLKKTNFFSVYILGIFSAIATTCCAPVLAGVLALSVLPGSFLLGGLYTLSYVLGMVMPLFILSLFLDKSRLMNKLLIFRKTFHYSLFGKTVYSSFSNFFSGLMFLVLGLVIFYLALTNNLLSHNSYQISLNIYLTKFIQFISTYTKILPEFVWGILFVGIFLIFGFVAFRQFRSLLKERRIN